MNVQKMIDDYLLKVQEERKNHISSGKWTPSRFGRCYRMQYWKRAGEKETNPPDLNSLRRFKAGDLFHQFVQQFLPAHEVEVRIERDDILGFADIVTEDSVIDIKSQHSRAFWYMEKEEIPISEQKYSNILQVTTYAYLLGKPNAQLMFISKDDLYVAEYVFPVEQWINDIEFELYQLRKYWSLGQLPPAEPRAYKNKKGEFNECKYCPFLDKCKEVENA